MSDNPLLIEQIPLLGRYLSKYNFQLQNLYYFTIVSSEGEGLGSIDFFATKHSIPMDSLEVGDFPFGKKYYKGYEPVEEFEITFLMPDENTPDDQNPLFYFMKWLNVIYNFDRKCFNVLEREEQKYKSANLILLSNDYFMNQASMRLPNSWNNLEFSYRTEINIENLMPLGLDSIEVDDNSGEPIEMTFKFACEGVSIKKSNGKIIKSSGLTR